MRTIQKHAGRTGEKDPTVESKLKKRLIRIRDHAEAITLLFFPLLTAADIILSELSCTILGIGYERAGGGVGYLHINTVTF